MFYRQKTGIYVKDYTGAQIPAGCFLKCDVHVQNITSQNDFSSLDCATIVVIQMPTPPKSNDTYLMFF